jgi:thiol-disulfide isomerase/thioredoxin
MLACCILLLSCSTFAQTKVVKPAVTLTDSGNVFHFIDMMDIDGKIVRAKDLAGKTIVVNFWFIGCPPCRYEIPFLSQIAKKYSNRDDIVFIAISDDKTPAIRVFLEKTKFEYRLIGDGAPIFTKYGVDTCPLSLVINKKGIITFNSSGYRIAAVPDNLQKHLDKLDQ